jgi:branched-chain amino acid transport system ATP-binding protein
VNGQTLKIENLTVVLAHRSVVRDVSLEVPPAAITALLGPNGAGKSTLVLTVGGVLKPAAGSVRLGERDLTRQSPEKVRAAGVAIVPEGRKLLSELTVEENLRVATYTQPRNEATASIDGTLELFPELKKRWQLTARSLSGGEQQMLVLAQALSSKPTTLLVDELSLGLAPAVVKRLVPRLEAVAQTGVGVLLIEQFANIALHYASAAYVIEGGRIRYSGDAATLREHPEMLASAYLAGTANEPSPSQVE